MVRSVPKIAFYSPIGGTWKTTLTLLTGLNLAETYNIKTLAIDLDIDKPGFASFLEGSDSLSIIDGFMGGKFTGEPIKSPWSDNLYLIPMRTNVQLSSLVQYTISFEVSRIDEEIRKRTAQILSRIIDDAADSVNAEIALIDMSSGIGLLQSLVLKYVINGVILLTRPDKQTVKRFVEILSNLADMGYIRLRASSRYDFVHLLFVWVPLGTHGKCIDDSVLSDLNKLYREVIRPRLRLVNEVVDSIPLIPDILSGVIEDHISVMWENRDRYPFNCIIDVINNLSIDIGRRFL